MGFTQKFSESTQFSCAKHVSHVTHISHVLLTSFYMLNFSCAKSHVHVVTCVIANSCGFEFKGSVMDFQGVSLAMA